MSLTPIIQTASLGSITSLILGPLTLGDVIFDSGDYSVPEKINFGGKQTLAVHKLIGGQRVIDAMGVDDAEIKWSGRFQGPLSTLRARSLDALRQSGKQVTLSWNSFSYQVVVSETVLNFERWYQVTYEVTCVIVSNPSSLNSFASTLDGAVLSDMVVMSGLVSNFASIV